VGVGIGLRSGVGVSSFGEGKAAMLGVGLVLAVGLFDTLTPMFFSDFIIRGVTAIVVVGVAVASGTKIVAV
jgi:uncharacterized protein (DUF2062 family)